MNRSLEDGTLLILKKLGVTAIKREARSVSRAPIPTCATLNPSFHSSRIFLPGYVLESVKSASENRR